MRWMAVAVLALTLAGCAAPEAATPLLGFCPQWVQSPGEHRHSYDGTAGLQVLEPGNLTYLGRPFDMFRLRIDALSVPNGTLELRAYASDNGTRGTQRNWRDFRPVAPQSVPVVVLDGAAVGKEFEATLTSIAQQDPARPGPLQLAWTPSPGTTVHVEYTVTEHYKVCGIE
ncbi:MAG TPA: hypothetical protein VM286_08595 [Candidatus Thermoplasmatota archaeon]|nr:hypothetical protein [Candidatus Thermoplasmatota archaeon]